ncbi:hypothetical protein A4D02_20430 [Niastella koreensis]|uniref:Uncharacterized protein n=2 Tax=Niastella koreensis TaxID=354356 RepID=G8TKA0_NIAKG|nr:hypothetical protein [Niastella koreensis]AEV96534.1 hypothetical protein Niako_0133 [Niastella koreensis GR20-10]OQP54050.1 hypothetical protein A4D02_20430 [Niastella koreensis]
MGEESNDLYVIPAKFRKIENLHILFWLMKDLCWCLLLRPLGIIMIFPTLTVAIWIAWRNRHIVAELTHNVAIALWIVANSMWMIDEFYFEGEKIRHYCVIPFSLGILTLFYYYFYYSPLQRKKAKAAEVANKNAEHSNYTASGIKH